MTVLTVSNPGGLISMGDENIIKGIKQNPQLILHSVVKH